MSITEITRKATEIKELEIMADELAAEIAALKDEIKAQMGDQTQIVAGAYKITWSPVTSTRIDTAALKAALPDVADRFSKTSTTRRFCIA